MWPHAFGPHQGLAINPFLSSAPIETLKNINSSNTFEQKVVFLVATFFGAGLAPFAPGTFGSAAGVMVFLGFVTLPTGLYALTVLTLFALGVWAADRAEGIFRRHDDGRIVIDEVVGQLLTLSPLLWSAQLLRAGEQIFRGWEFWLLLSVGFLMFRVLDILKPGPIRKAEQFVGGLGVMLDDVVAGIFGAVVMGVLLLVLGGGLHG